jgi:sigma-B regulation protein RsbU (phosphoserine phosphatase)
MGLETAWIVVRDDLEPDGSNGGYRLAAHHNLPPALDPDDTEAWQQSCTCRELCQAGQLTEAYNEVLCSRLQRSSGDRAGLAVHASVPLRSGERTLGILNVAAPDWPSFATQSLSLLTVVGAQVGLAMERAHLYDLLRERRVREQAMLLHFSTQLLSRLGLDDLMPYLVEEIRQILSADACALLMPGEGSGDLEFRASSGWRVDPGARRRRVPWDETSGAGLVMATLQPLQAEDLSSQDPTPWAPAWLQEEGFRGHAVVPLLVEGRAVGVLVVNQREPRRWDDADMHYLQLMANQAAIAIEKVRLHHEVVRMEALDRELAVGQQIQLSMLPETPPELAGWEFAVLYRPAREVGGDFYDFFDLPGGEGELGVVVGDVTGKGVPAALFMARSSTLIRSAGRRGLSPANALAQANESILKDRPSELLLTALYARVDAATGRLLYANAGHNRPMWLPALSRTVRELDGHGILMGAFDQIELEECSMELAPGDMLVLFTDGVTEAMDAEHQPFGEERLQQAVAAAAGANAQKMLEAITSAVEAHVGIAPQSDDITLVVMKRSAG